MKPLIVLLAVLLAVVPSCACMETAEDNETIVTIVRAPDQDRAERPPCFPDPSENFVPLPETENIAENA